MDYRIERRGMKSGRVEQEKYVYNKAVGKRGTWYFPSNSDHPADNIYFRSYSKDKSEGFAGRVLEFHLKNGEVDLVQGPWNSNAQSFLDDTGVDLRDKFRTFGVVAKGIRYDGNDAILTDVLYIDDEPVIGEFDRIEKIAQNTANALGIKVRYYSESAGGSITSWCDPVVPTEED